MSAMKPASLVLLITLSFLLPSANTYSQQPDPNLYSGLRWRMNGPFRAGRVNAVSGVTGKPDTFYFGSVGCGVWKSQQCGRIWTPLFDTTRVASIGATT